MSTYTICEYYDAPYKASFWQNIVKTSAFFTQPSFVIKILLLLEDTHKNILSASHDIYTNILFTTVFY